MPSLLPAGAPARPRVRRRLVRIALLLALVLGAGKVLTREQLMRDVWGMSRGASSKTLDMHISWLRRKLGDDAASPRLITTIRGLGFRFERG